MENRDLIIEINKLKEQIKQQESLLNSFIQYVYKYIICASGWCIPKPPGIA